MKKVIFETIGNTIMFILLALFLTEGLVVTGLEGFEEGVEISVNFLLALILVFYLLAYGIALAIINRRQGAPFYYLICGLQLHLDTDERESIVTQRATKIAYMSTICILPIALVIFVSVNILFCFAGVDIDMFTVGCWLFILSCIAVNMAFSIAWCVQYNK